MLESKQSTKKVASRAVAQKAYKKLKKKRAKVKQAEKKELETENSSTQVVEQQAAVPSKWHRVTMRDGCRKATDRSVDVDKINELLEIRSKSKAEKNYAASDEITRTLVDMEIVYNDEKRQWHTRLLLTAEQKAKKEEKELERKQKSKNKKEPVSK